MQRLLLYVKSSSSKTHILIYQNWCECVLYFGLSNMQTQWDVCRKWTMMTSSSGNIFSALLAICAGNSPVTGEFSAQMPVTQSFDVFFDLRLNNDWANIREAGDLRHHGAHYDVPVMHYMQHVQRDVTWATLAIHISQCRAITLAKFIICIKQ